MRCRFSIAKALALVALFPGFGLRCTAENRVAVGAERFDVDLPRPKTGMLVSASDYGFSPANDFNAAAVNRAVEAARREGADGVRLGPGVYNCFDVPYGIQLTNLTDFVLDGRGAVLVFRRPAEFVNRPQSDLVHERASILVKDCRRTLVKDLKMDWDWERDPLASFAVCTDVHLDEGADDASYVDLLFPDYVRHPAFGRDLPVQLITAMEPSCARFAQGGRNWHFGGAEGVFGSRNAWLGENRLRVWPAVRQEGKPYFQPAAFLLSPERNRDCVRDMRVGGHYRLMHRYYGKNGINLVSNRHLTLKDVVIWSCFGMGVVIDGKQAYTKLDGVRIEPRADAAVRRPVSSSSDAIHVARSSGHIILTNVCVRLNNDDSLNIHDRFTLAARRGLRVLEIVNARGMGYFRPDVSDRIELRRPDWGPTGFGARIAAISGNRLTLDCDLPEDLVGEFMVFDREYGSNQVVLRQCEFSDSPSRNLLSASNLTVENCVFRRQGRIGLCLLGDARMDVWCEGLGETNVVFRNNVFESCAVSDPSRPVFQTSLSSPKEWGVVRPDASILRDVLIEGNVIRDPFGPAARFLAGTNIVFRGNAIEFTRPPFSPRAGVVEVGPHAHVKSDAKIRELAPALTAVFRRGLTEGGSVCRR